MLFRRLILTGAVSTGLISCFASVFTTQGKYVPATGLRLSAGVLKLPSAFAAKILSRAGDMMHDGFRTPARPDGMACFLAENGDYILMRNHEVSWNDRSRGPYLKHQSPVPEAYDPNGMGGVTRLVINPATLEVVSSNLVLAGTVRNCAGGISPWGWLSCEESTETDHGYVFLCRPNHDKVQPPERIAAYGRFNHEAAVVEPNTLIAYLTEDRGDGCFYRFVPDDRSKPFAGKLQALRIVNRPGYHTGEIREIGQQFAVDWVDIPDPNPRRDNVRNQAAAFGAATVSRGEGLWLGEEAVYFAATNGGPALAGQIFMYTPTSGSKGSLEAVAISTSREQLDHPDNICVAPWGDLYIAEDGGGYDAIRLLKPNGTLTTFAANALSRSELAGVCFSPDGKNLFVNIQEQGLTIAIQGPFQDI